MLYIETSLPYYSEKESKSARIDIKKLQNASSKNEFEQLLKEAISIEDSEYQFEKCLRQGLENFWSFNLSKNSLGV